MQTRKRIAITKQDSERKFHHLSNNANFIFGIHENYAENLLYTRLGYFGQNFRGKVQFQMFAKIGRAHTSISEQIKLILVEKFIVI